MRSTPPTCWSLIPLALATCACRTFQPTIAQRQGYERLGAGTVPLSIAEEFEGAPIDARSERVERDERESRQAEYVAPKLGGDELLQVEFRGAPLAQVLHFLADRAGVNIVLDAGVDRTVDLSFPSITLDAAMHSVLTRNGLRLVEDPPGVYFVELWDGTQEASANFTLSSVKATDVEANLRALLGSSSTLVVDPKQNLIVVRGAQSDVELVREFLERVDRLQRQVLIEVRILEVSLGDRFQLGLDASANGTVQGHLWNLVQGLATSDDSFTYQFTSSAGDLDATINAMRRITGTDLVSSPRVLAVTGTEASVEVVTEVPYVNVTSTTSGTTGGVGTSVVEEVQFKEAGIKLKVMPTIQEGGSIAVHIDQELSEVVDTFKDIPVIDKRFLKTDLLVQDRSTVVLGGLMQNKRTEVDKGVPWLMDVPLLGRLFHNDDDTSGKRELLVFLTPRIVDGAEAAELTQTLRNAYRQAVRDSGVSSHAERR
ncbi:MAG: type II secretion system protein GspD [Planctomycetes bacterium]|nr:type II secretion system protein GspD [Planctomycetota bacterium]